MSKKVEQSEKREIEHLIYNKRRSNASFANLIEQAYGDYAVRYCKEPEVVICNPACKEAVEKALASLGITKMTVETVGGCLEDEIRLVKPSP